MTTPLETVLVADVGNTRIKLAAVTPGLLTGRLPAVAHRHDLPSRDFRAVSLRQWLDRAAPGPAIVYAASVHETAAAGLEAAFAEVGATSHRPVRQRRITGEHLGIVLAVDEPGRVGVDRVAAAAAAAAAKDVGRSAIVVDCGTATTVDVVAADGRFLGGAILPGPGLLARALAEGTSRLPAVAELDSGGPPVMPGSDTQRAIAAGIGFGMRGAVVRLVAEAAAAVGGDPQVFLTGGSRGVVRDALPAAIEIPDLVLHGIALAAGRLQSRP